MGKVRDFAEKMWTGEQVFSGDANPLALFAGIEELDAGLAFMSSFSNITALTTDAGLVLIDTGAFLLAPMVHQQIRTWSAAPVHTAVYTHGHVDHAFGLEFFEREAEAKGWARTEVIGHEALPARFDRYQLTAGYNEVINARQFRAPGVKWPTRYRYPDRTYRDSLAIEVGVVGAEVVIDTDRHMSLQLRATGD